MRRDKPLSSPLEFAERERYDLICEAFSTEAQSVPVNDGPRIYGKKDLSLWAVVDPCDWDWLSQWKWSYCATPRGKYYIARRTGNATKVIDGISYRMAGKQRTIYLHREVMLRKGDVPPDKDHKIIDHADGNSLNCRRSNLRWATTSFNNRNRFGSHFAAESCA